MEKENKANNNKWLKTLASIGAIVTATTAILYYKYKQDNKKKR